MKEPKEQPRPEEGLHLHFDGAAGAAGDMLLGVFLALGVPRSCIEDAFDKVGVGSSRLLAEKVSKGGVEAVDVKIAMTPQDKAADHRHYGGIRKQIEGSELSRDVKATALAIFQRLAKAEAVIHSTTVEKVHFHEVGAIDAIADIVGSAAAFHWLAPSTVSGAPPCVGEGSVSSAHGRLPVPAPATLEIFREAGVPFRSGGVEKELCTPTGAAILAELVQSFSEPPAFVALRVGYGAGDCELACRPNVARGVLGRRNTTSNKNGSKTSSKRFASELEKQSMMVVKANLDDMNPELFSHIGEMLMDGGAKDVWWTSVGMKKGRPGVELSCLCDERKINDVARLILSETTSLGVRISTCERLVSSRELQKVKTSYGEISVKIGMVGGRVTNIAPEYDECRRIALEQELPVKVVYAEAMAVASALHWQKQ